MLVGITSLQGSALLNTGKNTGKNGKNTTAFKVHCQRKFLMISSKNVKFLGLKTSSRLSSQDIMLKMAPQVGYWSWHLHVYV